jgi:hypothetical protein
MIRSSRAESYVTTDCQSANLYWNKAPIWGLGPDLYYCSTVAGLLMWGALSDDMTGLSFLAMVVILGSESRGIREHILLSPIRDFSLRRLLRLAGLRCRYSITPSYGEVSQSRSRSRSQSQSQSRSQSRSYITTDGQ